jgi:hypothetical protein
MIDLLSNSAHLRGRIIDGTIQVERLIDDYLAKYFCQSQRKSNELKELFFSTNSVVLDAKRSIFSVVIKRENPDFVKLNPKYLSRLDKFIPHRNIFAHAEIDTSSEAIANYKDEIVFFKYVNGEQKRHGYSTKKYIQLLQEVDYLTKKTQEALTAMPSMA